MKSKIFNFKKFSISRTNSAMKLTTDAVLLGSWTVEKLIISGFKNNKLKILDIGTGTGVLSLILAQFFVNSSIKAIDIDKGAIQDAIFNFSSSIYSDRITAQLLSLEEEVNQTYIDYHDYKNTYDVIICNPPYFDFSVSYDDVKRLKARCNESLTPNDLFKNCYKLLQKDGSLFIIIPNQYEKRYLLIASKFEMVPINLARVSSVVTKTPYVSLIELKRKDSNLNINAVLKTESFSLFDNSVKTEKWFMLTKELYLGDK
ncbi:MAG: methyltransferase [Succinivibrionaceae bacterium]